MAALETPRVERASRLHGIYVVLNHDGPDPLMLARAATSAGVRILQYRAKRGVVASMLRELRSIAHAGGALLIVNDDAEAALRFDCDGVHLGPGDDGFTAVPRIREALGGRLIGLSCGTITEALTANAQDVDYLGVGSVYATLTKADAGIPIGIDGLRGIARVSRFPVAAIGGIAACNVAEVARSGVAMAAVVSAIASAGDPAAAARNLFSAWEAGKQ